ncbi:MAG TPA: hypothetical protein VIT92_13160 [Burkholderiaceae bacterium]
MPGSTLDLDNIPVPDRSLGKGHDIEALGPSDLSDTGSDVQGGYSGIDDDVLGLDRGTNEDSDTRRLAARGDTDSTGTGESSTAGRNGDVELGGDIGFDRIDTMGADDNDDLDELGEDWPPNAGEASSQRATRH